jgi:hypothetical protein
MRVVALFAATADFTRVRCVALGAIRYLAVGIMAGRAVKGSMFAFIAQDLFLLQRVAVKTGAFALERYR